MESGSPSTAEGRHSSRAGMGPRRSHRRKREPVRLAPAVDDVTGQSSVDGRAGRSSRRAAIAAMAASATAQTAAAFAKMSTKRRAGANAASRMSSRVSSTVRKPRKSSKVDLRGLRTGSMSAKPSILKVRMTERRKKSMDSKSAKGLIGKRVSVRWPGDKNDYIGMVLSYSASSHKHKVFYYATEDKEEAIEVLDLSSGDRAWRLLDSEKSRSGSKSYDPDNLVGRAVRITWPVDDSGRKQPTDWDAIVVARKTGSLYRIAYLRDDWVEDRDFLADDLPWKVIDQSHSSTEAGVPSPQKNEDNTEDEGSSERLEVSHGASNGSIVSTANVETDRLNKTDTTNSVRGSTTHDMPNRFVGDGSFSTRDAASRSSIPHAPHMETALYVPPGASTVFGMFEPPLASVPRVQISEVAPLSSIQPAIMPSRIPDPGAAPLSGVHSDESGTT